jgi:hypothetical protein
VGHSIQPETVIPYGTTVCRWNQHVPHPTPRSMWSIIEPTGPQVKSYWAYGIGWARTTHRIRVAAKDLLTLPEYERAYKDYCNEKLLEVLKQ